MTVWAIVVAAGAGHRYGGPKQLEPLAGRRVLDWSVDAARSAADHVVLVLPPDQVEDGLAAGVDAVVAGGATRSASVRAGLAAVPDDAEVIVVHDAARPLAPAELFERVVAAVRDGAAGAVPGVAVADTLKRVEDGVVVGGVDRSSLVAVQTPQAFRAEALRSAHETGDAAANDAATDDAALVEAAGRQVVVVEGDRANLKVTEPPDLALAEALHPMGRPSARGRFRIGQGFDVHAWSDEPGRALVLGGVVIDGGRGLAGHSDADVVCHAAIDAVLGAAGLGDIGQHFPDTDARWAGADSVDLLARAVALAAQAGWAVANVDCTVVLEAPRLAPHRSAMAARLGQAAGAPVSVKATTAEGIGALGRGEGVACLAVALLGA